VRTSLEVADIFRTAGPAYRAAHAGHLSLHQLKIMSAIEHCRTAALGGHVEAFLDDGRLEIDNSEPVAAIGPRPLARAERAMRCVALGRKNWLFAGSKAGGERAAAIYSVIETAKLNGLEPQAYIADVIAKIASNWPAARWDELMPWNWSADRTPVNMAA
jgi:hypothetical protein